MDVLKEFLLAGCAWQDMPDKIPSPIAQRLISGLFGLVLVCGGFLAGSYIPTDLDGFTPVAAAVGILVPCLIMLGAFYLAYRMLKFAALARK
ncbi:MAG TPA: hypothetical protein VGG14_04300 [Candidatus Sulfotelmatobacter sp.]